MTKFESSSNDRYPIHLVVFDLGRVLMRICDNWQQACQRAGVVAPAENFDPKALHEVATIADAGQLDTHGFASAVSALVRCSIDDVLTASRAFLHGPFPGVEQLIEDLLAAGLQTACLSNTNENHWRIMNDPAEPAHLPLHRLTYRFASHLIRIRKPDAGIYDYLERNTGMAPSEIVFFDDLEVNIAAAAARGWRTHHVDPHSPDPIAFMRQCLRGDGVNV